MSVGVGLGVFGIAVFVGAALPCHCVHARGVAPPANHPNACARLAAAGSVPGVSCRVADAPPPIAATPASTTVPEPNEAVTFATLSPRNLQSFVKTWQPADKPLCKVLRSNADWDRWMGAAAVMGPHKPYAPPASLWSRKSIVLIARVVNAADPGTVFEMTGVRGDRQVLNIAYRMKAPSPASYKIGAWIGVVIGSNQLRDHVEITEDGTPVCAIGKSGKAASLIALPERPSSAI